MTGLLRRVVCFAVILFCTQPALLAQHELHWDAMTVTAHLDVNGSLAVAEEQTMVFSGDWNGGERVFSVRPRQTLSLEGMSRWNGSGWQPMREDGSLGSVDDYSLTDGRTLRWRSRLPTDPLSTARPSAISCATRSTASCSMTATASRSITISPFRIAPAASIASS
jgi:hypothetical protein